MREIMTRILCNGCGHEIETHDTDETEVEVVFDGHSGRVDLCGECRKHWTEQIAELLVNAMPLKKPKPVVTGRGGKIQPDGYQCSCGSVFDTQRGLSMHRTRMGHKR